MFHLATSGSGNDEAVMLRQRILVQAIIKVGISCQFVDLANSIMKFNEIHRKLVYDEALSMNENDTKNTIWWRSDVTCCACLLRCCPGTPCIDQSKHIEQSWTYVLIMNIMLIEVVKRSATMGSRWIVLIPAKRTWYISISITEFWWPKDTVCAMCLKESRKNTMP